MNPTSSDKTSSYKWIALAVLWVACFLQQGMRQIFPPLSSTIGAALGASDTIKGSVLSMFTLVYALAVPFSGMMGDFLSRKKIVVFSLAIFSAGVFSTGWVSSIIGIVICYGVINGFGQSFFYPAATSLLQQLHADRKATVLSILQLALYMGIIFMSYASGKLLDVFGQWEMPFKVFGLVGIVWAVALLFLLRDTKPPAVQLANEKKPSVAEAFKTVIVNPSAILLAMGLGMQIFVDVGFKMWMPEYLEKAFPGLEHASYGLHAVLWHYCGAFGGVMLGSTLADRWVSRRAGIRMEMNILGLLLGAPFIYAMMHMPTYQMTCVMMALFGFFRGLYDSNQFASIFDVVVPRYRASAMGVMLSCAFAFGAAAPIVLGFFKQHYSLQTGFLMLPVFFLVGALFILIARVFFLKRDYVGNRG